MMKISTSNLLDGFRAMNRQLPRGERGSMKQTLRDIRADALRTLRHMAERLNVESGIDEATISGQIVAHNRRARVRFAVTMLLITFAK